MSQKRVSVGNKVILFIYAIMSQFLNNDTQIGQTRINFIGFLETFSSGSCFSLSFWTCEIDNVELGINHLTFACFFVVNCENGVTSGAGVVHFRASYNSNFFSIFEHF